MAAVGSPTATLAPVSAQYPSSSADTSTLTRSPACSTRVAEGMPCAASWLTLMHVVPGKSYASCGAERAPCERNTSRAMASSAPVVIPGVIAANIASRAAATARPARWSPTTSSSPSTVIATAYE